MRRAAGMPGRRRPLPRCVGGASRQLAPRQMRYPSRRRSYPHAPVPRRGVRYRPRHRGTARRAASRDSVRSPTPTARDRARGLARHTVLPSATDRRVPRCLRSSMADDESLPTVRRKLDAADNPATHRAARLNRLTDEPFDVLVIGGGINGAGIARDAALRGLRTALVERDDFGSGTSSRSSRLVHGGVRYLEHGHLHLVFESSRERRTLLRIAPHLVRPLAFVWPVYAGARVPRWKLAAGLTLYDLLALFRNVKGHRLLTAKETWGEEPALSRLNLVGGASYYDAS